MRPAESNQQTQQQQQNLQQQSTSSQKQASRPTHRRYVLASATKAAYQPSPITNSSRPGKRLVPARKIKVVSTQLPLGTLATPAADVPRSAISQDDEVEHLPQPQVVHGSTGNARILIQSNGSLKKVAATTVRNHGQSSSGAADINQHHRLRSSEVVQSVAPFSVDSGPGQNVDELVTSRNLQQVNDVYGMKGEEKTHGPSASHSGTMVSGQAHQRAGSGSSSKQRSAGEGSFRPVCGAQFRSGRLRQGRPQQMRRSGVDQIRNISTEAIQSGVTSSQPQLPQNSGSAVIPVGEESQQLTQRMTLGAEPFDDLKQIQVEQDTAQFNSIEVGTRSTEQPLLRIVKPEQRFRRRLVAIAQAQQDKIKTLTSSQQKTKQIMTQSTSQLTAVNSSGPISNQNKQAQKFQYVSKSEERGTSGVQGAGGSDNLKAVGAINIQSTRNNNNEYNYATTQHKPDDILRTSGKVAEFQMHLKTQAASQGSARVPHAADGSLVEPATSARGAARDDLLKQGLNSVRTLPQGQTMNKRELGGSLNTNQVQRSGENGHKLQQKTSPRMQLQQITEANTRPGGPNDNGSYGTQPQTVNHGSTIHVGAALKQMHFQQPQTVKNAHGQAQHISIRRLPPQSMQNSSSRVTYNAQRRLGEASVESQGNVPPGIFLQQNPSQGSLQKHGGSFDRDRGDSQDNSKKFPTGQNYNRRRQMAQQNDDNMQFKILKALPKQGIPSSNTMDPQQLANELKYASLQTTPGQQSASGAQKRSSGMGNQGQLGQAVNQQKSAVVVGQGMQQTGTRFSATTSKATSQRKPSRGQQQSANQNVAAGQNKTKIKLTQLNNNNAFSTPHILNDGSTGNLNINQQQQAPTQVIFHPHPLNDKSLATNKAALASAAQALVASKQTPQIAQQQTGVLMTSERPHSQKQSHVSHINNRNSRKNFRPMAKKVQVGSHGRDRQGGTQVGHGSLMLKARSGSGEGTDRRHHQASGSTQPVSAVLGAVLNNQQKGMEMPQMLQVQTEASASTSRERALQSLHGNNLQLGNKAPLGQSLQLNLNLNQAAAKETYQTTQGSYMNLKDQQQQLAQQNGSLSKGSLIKKVKGQYQSTPNTQTQPGQPQLQRTQQLFLKYNQQQQPVGPFFQQQPSTKNSSLIKVNPGMQGQTRTLPTSSRYNQKISFQHTQPLQGLSNAAQQVQDGILSQRVQQNQQTQKRRFNKAVEGIAEQATVPGASLKSGSNSQQKLSTLAALNLNSQGQPGVGLAQTKNGSQMNFMASQTLDIGVLGNLNDLSSLNDNGTAANGMSSFSAIENLLMVEDGSKMSNQHSNSQVAGLNMYNSQDHLPPAIAHFGNKVQLPSKLSGVSSQAQSARASHAQHTGNIPPITNSGNLVKGSKNSGGSKIGSTRASRLQLNVNTAQPYKLDPQTGKAQAGIAAPNPQSAKWAQIKGKQPITDGVLNSLTGSYDSQQKSLAQTQRVQMPVTSKMPAKSSLPQQKLLGSQSSSMQSLKVVSSGVAVADKDTSHAAGNNNTVYGGGSIGFSGSNLGSNQPKQSQDEMQLVEAPKEKSIQSIEHQSVDIKQASLIDEQQHKPMQVEEASNPADEEDQMAEDAADNYNDSQALTKEQQQADNQPHRLQKSAAVLNLAQPTQLQLPSQSKAGQESGAKTGGNQRTTMDTNSVRKQQTTTSDSQQRTNFNTSMQNIPRGLINTAFSLSSVASRGDEHATPRPALPTTAQNILRYYIHELTDYEKGEVLDYETIYFLGKSKDKKIDKHKNGDATTNPGAKVKTGAHSEGSVEKREHSQDKEKKDDSQLYNNGYDDDKGDYKVVVGDHIGYRYEIIEFLGKGSFGTALGCFDHKEKREVAVKIVKNKKKYYYQASVELKILQYLRQHDHEDIMNVIHIEDYVVFRKHLCMSFERLSMNLFEFLKINDFNGFDHNLIRRFAIQLLYALKYLKQLEIIHCDLKPENILLKEENKSGIKIIDFGSSTFIDEKVYTYIQSRFYRAPEIMLGIPYTTSIDMWSLGCIMAELYIGYPLFPGESETDQMSRIMEMRDVPPPNVLRLSERKSKFFTKDKDTGKLEPVMLKNSRGKLRKPNGKPLDYVIGDEDEDFNDFVARCLDWNPETRLTPDEALKHVWVLKGLPAQVLIHHQKMHNIQTPELPMIVKEARDEFLAEQQREQELQNLRQAQQNQSRDSRQRGGGAAAREISQNPNTIQRPAIQLKTPRQSGTKNQNSQKKQGHSEYPQPSNKGMGINLVNQQMKDNNSSGTQPGSGNQTSQTSQLNSARKKFTFKK